MKNLVEYNIDTLISDVNNGWLTIGNKENNIISNLKCFKNYEEINILDVRKINLYKIHKSVYINMSKLQILDIRDNKIMKLSKNISHLKNLKVLRIDNNRLEYLPVEIAKLDNLETLTLNNNYLTHLPTSIRELLNLKTLKLSFNNINRLDVDLGHLKSLEVLHIDSNSFTEIPTTIYHLKHLSDFSLEWLEFLDPPFQKIVKDNIGQTIISVIKMSLLELLKDNKLYCNFFIFVEKNSNSNLNSINYENDNELSRQFVSPSKEIMNINNTQGNTVISNSNDYAKSILIKQEDQNNSNILKEINLEGNLVISVKNVHKLFLAIDNNYFGVLKSLLNQNLNYLKIKNNENKNILYLAIKLRKIEMIDFILSKINISTLPSPHLYLHKSIKMRDPLITSKILLHVDPNICDEEGNNAFHILFSSFYKNHSKCSLIGDLLLQYSCKPNIINVKLNAPIHIAIKKAGIECLEWIIMQNKVLIKEGKDQFDLNIKGKNGITCLHIAVTLSKVEEIIYLIENGSDVFAKTNDMKSSLKLHKGNFFIAKLIGSQERHILEKKYNINYNNHKLNIQNNYTTIEEINNSEDLSLLKKSIIPSNLKDTNNKNTNSQINKKKNYSLIKSNLKEEICKDVIKSKHKDLEIFPSNSYDISNCEETLKKDFFTSSNKKKNLIYLKYETPKFKSNFIFSNIITKENCEKEKSYNLHSSEKKSLNKNPIHDILFYKDIILNPESTIAEKYDSLMIIKTNFKRNESDSILKLIIENINLEFPINELFFIDVCRFLVPSKYIGFSGIIESKIYNNKLLKRTTILEVKNTIMHLNLEENKVIDRLNDFQNKGIQNFLKRNTPSKLFNDKVVFNLPKMNLMETFNSEISNISIDLLNGKNKTKIKNYNENYEMKECKKLYFQASQNDGDNLTIDEFNFDEMNENGNNQLDTKLHINYMPKKLLKEVNSKGKELIFDELSLNCLSNDSSRSNINSKINPIQNIQIYDEGLNNQSFSFKNKK